MYYIPALKIHLDYLKLEKKNNRLVNAFGTTYTILSLFSLFSFAAILVWLDNYYLSRIVFIE